MSNIAQTLQRYLEAELLGLPPSTLTPTSDLFEHGLDSLGLAGLLIFIEDEWKVRVPAASIVTTNLKDIQSITALVESLQPAAA
jgi:acyl carrier protein